MSRATMPSPMVASTKLAASGGPEVSSTVPNVSNEAPESTKASRGTSMPNAQ